KDPSSDIAVLAIDPSAVKGGLKPLQFASSKSLRPGDPTIAIGSPFGLEGTVTTGIISALGREIEAPNGFSIPGALQTDATVSPGTPAADAGIRQGDLIIGFDGQTVRNPSDLSLNVLKKQPGDTVKVTLKRGGETKTVTVKLGNRPNKPVQ